MYVNVGARDKTSYKDIPTKRALKDAIAADRSDVWFYGTSDFQPFKGTADDLDVGIRYSVVGPNPYTSRKWYATVERHENGKITVK